jgi:hypothetical protein
MRLKNRSRSRMRSHILHVDHRDLESIRARPYIFLLRYPHDRCPSRTFQLVLGGHGIPNSIVLIVPAVERLEDKEFLARQLRHHYPQEFYPSVAHEESVTMK